MKTPRSDSDDAVFDFVVSMQQSKAFSRECSYGYVLTKLFCLQTVENLISAAFCSVWSALLQMSHKKDATLGLYGY